MKKVTYLFILFAILFSFKSYSQDIFPVKYRVEKQAMSTPMSNIEEVFFNNPYYTRPINVKFDGKQLHLFYDNGASFIKKQVTEVESKADFDDDNQIIKRYFYTFNDNTTDTLMFVVDYEVSYVQIALPTKNTKGENVGYTSYKKYMEKEKLALK